MPWFNLYIWPLFPPTTRTKTAANSWDARLNHFSPAPSRSNTPENEQAYYFPIWSGSHIRSHSQTGHWCVSFGVGWTNYFRFWLMWNGLLLKSMIWGGRIHCWRWLFLLACRQSWSHYHIILLQFIGQPVLNRFCTCLWLCSSAVCF